MASTGLICVTAGALYERYARRMFASASDHFHPTEDVIAFRRLNGRDGAWPAGTLYRYHALLEHADELDFDYLFMIDADMRFDGPVRGEILADGITATQHPGYVGMPREALPFERRTDSAACVPADVGDRYYAGGFIGGKRDAFLRLARTVALSIDSDDSSGAVACWHDESHLNRYLARNPPATVLSPAYCHPDDDSFYISALWPEPYERLITALDKAADERVGR